MAAADSTVATTLVDFAAAMMPAGFAPGRADSYSAAAIALAAGRARL
jgi:hypothetical protein